MRRPAAPALVTLAAIGAVIAIVVWQTDPSLLLANTTTTGGDTGAHVALAAFLKNNLIGHLHVTGWDPGAYDGFPLNTFYFPLPDVLAALAGFVIPFNVAFKLVTILGSLTLPVAAWAFGRLAGLERPRPAVLAVATLPFLFDQTFTIYGGNLYSTFAGEYAYSLGLSIALVFLGIAIRGMRTGRLRVVGALSLAACVLCHIVTGGFALVGAALVLLLAGPTRRRVWWMVSTVGTGLLLVAWWLVPFVLEQAYSTNMGWTNVTTYLALLAPRADHWALVLGAIGTVVALVRRQQAAILLVALAVISAAVLRFDPQGKLYNVRVLPLWWLCVYLVAGYCVAEAGWVVAALSRRLRVRLWQEENAMLDAVPERAPDAAGATLRSSPGALALASTGPPLDAGSQSTPDAPPRTRRWTRSRVSGILATSAVDQGTTPLVGAPREPAGAPTAQGDGPRRRDDGGPREARRPRPRFGPWAPGAVAVPLVALAAAALVVVPPLVVPSSGAKVGPFWVSPSSVSSWAQWNYEGYQRQAGWPELHDGIVATMDKVSRRYGCGRAMWEYNANEDRFGTPEALMNLPYWTGGCIDSMEGLLFESSATTPYHFLDQSELSAEPSDAMAGCQPGSPPDCLPYSGLNVALGVEHLQMLGVKYYMASTPAVQAQASADPDLSLVASTGPWRTPYEGTTVVTTWRIYRVHDAALVAPLTRVPQVLTGVGQGQTSWLPVAKQWYLDPSEWDQELVASGPASWPRTTDKVTPGIDVPLPSVRVSDIRMGTDSLRFHVDRTGVPVLVRVSYFPAWHAKGAIGPWRAEPNLMVVVPTSHDVTLTYGSTPAGNLGLVLTVVGLAAVVVLWWRRRSDPGGWWKRRALLTRHADGDRAASSTSAIREPPQASG